MPVMPRFVAVLLFISLHLATTGTAQPLTFDRDDYASVSGTTDRAGNTKYRPGTTSGLSVSLEECSGCGVSGWGWEDDGWGAINRNGVLLRFPEGGAQRIVIQTREDGVSIDQVVLSSEKYLTTRPGLAKNDATILPATWTPF